MSVELIINKKRATIKGARYARGFRQEPNYNLAFEKEVESYPEKENKELSSWICERKSNIINIVPYKN